MLEAVILDNTERLLKSSGESSKMSNIKSLIASIGQTICYGRDSNAASPFSHLAAFGTNEVFSAWRSDTNNVLLIARSGSPYEVLSINLTTGAITTDSSGKLFEWVNEDASGVIWAVATNAGVYGLYKRTGAAAWTLVLSDSGVGKMRRWVNEDLYYLSNTGNWYKLANGSATVSTDPNTVIANSNWMTYAGSQMTGNDIVCSYPLTYSPRYWTALGTLPVTPSYYGSTQEYGSTRYWTVNAASSVTTGTLVAPLADVNWETIAECVQGNVPNTTGDRQTASAGKHNFHRLDDTYMLHTISMLYDTTASGRDPNIGARKIVLCIVNKTTGINKYIGTLYLTGSSTIGVSATAASIVYGNVLGAKLASGVLDLWIAQGTNTTNVATDVYGLFKVTLNLNLDF